MTRSLECRILMHMRKACLHGDLRLFQRYSRYPDRKDWIFNHVIWHISVLLRDTTPIKSDSIEIFSSVESEKVRVISLCKYGNNRDNRI